jgi:uncharacterized protein Veg
MHYVVEKIKGNLGEERKIDEEQGRKKRCSGVHVKSEIEGVQSSGCRVLC